MSKEHEQDKDIKGHPHRLRAFCALFNHLRPDLSFQEQTTATEDESSECTAALQDDHRIYEWYGSSHREIKQCTSASLIIHMHWTAGLRCSLLFHITGPPPVLRIVRSFCMSHGWSKSDKDLVKSALARAQKRANAEALQLFKNESVRSIDDLWALELKIRDWKKERYQKFYFDHSTAEELLCQCIKRGWLKISDLQSMSEERLEKIKEMANPAIASRLQSTPPAGSALGSAERTANSDMNLTDSQRPGWQAERGPRYGNNRKGMALTKVQERRTRRARDREEIHKLSKEDQA